MADTKKHKSVSIPILAWKKANFLQTKIVDGTKLSTSKVVEILINEETKKNNYQENIINFTKINKGEKI